MKPPIATYRIQFTPEFTFDRCREILPYLQELGISHIYASPIFEARPGSMHGYDVCDHNRFNPELGGEEEFEALSREVATKGFGWIQDIVPNHMAVSGQNPMLVDVLENGAASRFFSFFDIDWEYPDPGFNGRMLAPFLGSFFSESLENGEIRLGYDRAGFHISYYDLRFPVRIESYAQILTHHLKALQTRLGREHADYVKLLGILYSIKNLSAVEQQEDRYDQISFIKWLLFELFESSAAVRGHIESTLEDFNGGTGREGEDSYAKLEDLLSTQLFRLSFWKVAGEEVNYRRFFSINELISLRMELPAVFDHVHRLVLEMIEKGTFTGLRIDHIDGLYDPTQYLRRLRDRVGDAPVWVEKILSVDEPLPRFWPAQGTTGYEFMNMVCSLFVQNRSEHDFTRTYQRFTGMKTPFPDLVEEKKKLIIKRYMTGDVDNLARLVKTIAARDRRGFDITLHGMQRAVLEVLAAFPVYRTYISHDVFRPHDRTYIKKAVSAARSKNPDLTMELDFLERFLMLSIGDQLSREDKEEWIRFVMRFQQFTGPLMAKGYEDTTLYVMNRLLCLNEVGGWPDRFGIDMIQWEEFNRDRQENWPATMNGTATHDTKRGEDARLRLAALSELPQEWNAALKRFAALNARKRKRVGRVMAPDRNDEYFLYQTMLASCPLEEDQLASFRERLKQYLEKAVREAKTHTGWLKPHQQYEQHYFAFAESLLQSWESPFMQEFLPLVRRVAFPAMVYSLGQTVIKLTAPGIPDVYQGTELWDLSFVDPDNRRPVDYRKRHNLLSDLTRKWEGDPLKCLREILAAPQDGRIKLFCLHRGLKFRQNRAELFDKGEFVPLAFQGTFSNHLIGFARIFEGQAALTVVPRYLAGMNIRDAMPLAEIWQDTVLLLPEAVTTPLTNAFSPQTLPVATEIRISEILKDFPVALLAPQDTTVG
ncbi:MAG: malto-oligosyltrehalose synthase [Desulfovibrionales bacterium]